MKIIIRFLIAFWIILFIAISACGNSTPTPETEQDFFDLVSPSPVGADKAQALLLSGGYGYVYGDMVLLDTKSSPKTGDVVLYNGALNKSDFQAFGPGYQLAKVIALPGEGVTFARWSYQANGYDVVLQEHNAPETTKVLWGADIYTDVAGLTLQVPGEEYLGDRWIGREGRPEDFGQANYFGYNRFTIKKAAISGIVIKKTGHKEIPQITW